MCGWAGQAGLAGRTLRFLGFSFVFLQNKPKNLMCGWAGQAWAGWANAQVFRFSLGFSSNKPKNLMCGWAGQAGLAGRTLRFLGFS